MPDNVIHELQQPLTLINVGDVTKEEHEKVRNSGTTATSTSCATRFLAQTQDDAKSQGSVHDDSALTQRSIFAQYLGTVGSCSFL